MTLEILNHIEQARMETIGYEMFLCSLFSAPLYVFICGVSYLQDKITDYWRL
jgi:hypothetical protein